MLTYEAFVSVFFRWIDFGVIIAGAGYIFYKWGLPFLDKAREGQQAIRMDIEHNITQSIIHTQLLEQTLQQDKVFIHQLEQKVKFWNEAVAQKQLVKQQQSKRIADHIAQENEHRAKQIKQIMLHKLAIAEALEQAECQLRKKFSSKQASAGFVKEIIQRLQES